MVDSRKDTNVAARRLVVLEHDGPKEKPTPLEHQIAILLYARDVLEWKLQIVISTGGKGVHGLFDADSIEPMKFQTDAAQLAAFGADPVALNRSATRIPGAIRQRTKTNPGGQRQCILWINPDLTSTTH